MMAGVHSSAWEVLPGWARGGKRKGNKKLSRIQVKNFFSCWSAPQDKIFFKAAVLVPASNDLSVEDAATYDTDSYRAWTLSFFQIKSMDTGLSPESDKWHKAPLSHQE